MSMTRKNYVAFAKMLALHRPAQFEGGVGSGWSDAFVLWIATVRDTADIFAWDNRQFSRERFYAACGVQEGNM